ncbi:MAG: branched-chain amino acid ABC transporter permease [Rhodospirillaceae bacterium]|jgi:branched-chain amino acid transport system permease protein|nr:branched-chain amino acid ABC transporter permease [Rhodospirillaceae bacterium]MBT3887294.1 branched-chain amino acid ABC transporter permease [Rhodospirillaceae bacterium]MBT4118521.1 branched-chain amino acid ABC transporter permease [Rhodospirillaceae bacterium]MBT4671983.1 branched-chain amino acid ABC transporter permease [Rhodospirillaceae bacterium]MBT4720677.1 branched-chain amino acid ABC transporter permease [Rhodospirillaceae bacterium]
MKLDKFWIACIAILILGFVFTKNADNEFYFFTTYVILQGLVMAVAWNILGGFTGYVNFGAAGFFAVGVYTSVALNKAFGLPLPVILAVAGIIGGLLGLGAGYLTLRLKGVYFAIATLATALVIETIVNNWKYVGGAAGTYVLQPKQSFIFDNYIELLFMLMLVLSVAAVAISRYLSSSRVGKGLAAIRDDEVAAECMGVPTLRLKLISTTAMGVLMSIAGAPFPFFVTFVDPVSAFALLIAVNAIAMPMIGGTAYWYGPVIGALILGVVQETATVTISSELNLLIVGVLLVLFITMAPQGIVGVYHDWRKKRDAK